MANRSDKRKEPCHVNLNEEQIAILDAIAKEKGKTRTGIEPNRSQLIVKAIDNFIDDCRRENDLKQAIEQTELNLRRLKLREDQSKAKGRALEVVS
ncbi:MAG TPA: hypothetical protein VEJ46_04640 [Candidatus Acidoferrum sp.]|nr:hypothetical protein [Candidatus Acidoferrum sp.]